MTLREWEDAHPKHPKVRYLENGSVCIPDFPMYADDRFQLWHLSDYCVSSVAGGSIWFIPRKV